MVWWCPRSAPTRCVTRGGPHTLSEPCQMGRVPVPAAAGPPFGYTVAGAGPVGPAPPQSGASWPGLQPPLEARTAAERMGRRHAPGPARRQPGLERGGCRLPARGPAR